jgi:hypothetical protein
MEAGPSAFVNGAYWFIDVSMSWLVIATCIVCSAAVA